MPAEPRAVLLDTHVLLWWRSDRKKLSATAESLIDGSASLLLSPMTFWEVGMLVDERRIRLDRSTATWTADVLRHDRVEVAELTPDIAVRASELSDFHGDPSDRLLYATAQARRVPLVTKDGKMHEYARDHTDVVVRW